jgi:hypothetical protein
MIETLSRDGLCGEEFDNVSTTFSSPATHLVHGCQTAYQEGYPMRPSSLTCRILSIVGVVFGVVWSGPATADLVTDWNVQAFEVAAAAGTSSAALRARAVAMVHAAMHDSLNAIEPRYSVYAVTAPASPQASPEAAVIGAATGVLSRLFPPQAALLDAARASALMAIPDGDAKRSGLALGDQVAAEIIARRSEDKFEQYFRLEPYTPQPGPGAFQPPPPTPPATASVAAAPNIAQVTPFLLRSTAQFRAPGPPALTSEAYTRDFNEVKTIGAKDSPTRPGSRSLPWPAIPTTRPAAAAPAPWRLPSSRAPLGRRCPSAPRVRPPIRPAPSGSTGASHTPHRSAPTHGSGLATTSGRRSSMGRCRADRFAQWALEHFLRPVKTSQ